MNNPSTNLVRQWKILRHIAAAPEDTVFSAQALALEFGAHRMTIARDLWTLAVAGFLIPEHGKKSFRQTPRTTRDVERIEKVGVVRTHGDVAGRRDHLRCNICGYHFKTSGVNIDAQDFKEHKRGHLGIPSKSLV